MHRYRIHLNEHSLYYIYEYCIYLFIDRSKKCSLTRAVGIFQLIDQSEKVSPHTPLPTPLIGPTDIDSCRHARAPVTPETTTATTRGSPEARPRQHNISTANYMLYTRYVYIMLCCILLYYNESIYIHTQYFI